MPRGNFFFFSLHFPHQKKVLIFFIPDLSPMHIIKGVLYSNSRVISRLNGLVCHLSVRYMFLSDYIHIPCTSVLHH